MGEPPLFATLQVRRISVVLMAVATSVGTPGASEPVSAESNAAQGPPSPTELMARPR